MDQIRPLVKDVIHLVRFGSEGRTRDVKALARRMATQYRQTLPDLSQTLSSMVASEGLLRSAKRPLPIDADSRLALARVVDPALAEKPILPKEVDRRIEQLIAEHEDPAALQLAGLSPARSALLIGLPGVGKTMAAKWIARRLDRPLVVLDLASSISSFLGKTGQNLRQVFDFCKEFDCILLLDEVDAIAKSRADETDLGELKRLVNVLLQELDEWPEGSLLLAATNHQNILDPAFWRRFDTVLEFPLPGATERSDILAGLLPSVAEDLVLALREISQGMTPAEIVRRVRAARRIAIITKSSEPDELLNSFADHLKGLPAVQRHEVSERLMVAGISQRRASDLTGTSRNTLRKRANKGIEAT